MNTKLRISLFFLITVIVFSCNDNDKVVDTYFGGKIINPKTNNIILYYQEKAIDTFLLDENNSFLAKLDIKNEGLFYFKHGPEHQYIYIEPKDSILIRLNAWSFDESLVFSGKGADRNNMLIDCYIDAEKDKKSFYSYYKFKPQEFKLKVRELEKEKMKRFHQFFERNKNETEPFKEVLKMALTYPLYSKVESYPLAQREEISPTTLKSLDSIFYNHRSKININKDSIMFFYAYRDYVMSHLYNSVFSAGHDINSDDFTIGLLNKIHQNITYEKTKNTLLRQIAIGHFYRKSSCEINSNAFDEFFKMSTSEEDKHLIKKLLDDVDNINKGKDLIKFEIVDSNNNLHNIKSVIKGKNSVIYFWNPTYISKDYLGSKVAYLSKKYPDVNFVGVKIIDGEFDRITNLDIKSQFYINSKSKANIFLTSKMPRTILVDKKGIVVNGFASLSSQNIYKQIKDLANNQ